MPTFAKRIEESAAHVRAQWPIKPQVGIILGSGLGNFADNVHVDIAIPYDEIPGFPRSASAVIGHQGELLCGTVANVPVVTMAGRFHFYEGYGIRNITLPVRVMVDLGIEFLIVSNASGGLNPLYNSGDIMVLDDHINLMFQNPLIGVNDDCLGPRFPDMSAPYDRELIELCKTIAAGHDFPAHQGVYAAFSGPTYETRAEYRFLRRLGADVVGMSTVPEVIAAVHSGIRVLALSAVTNLCRPDVAQVTGHHEVVDAAQIAEPKLTKIVLGVVETLRGRSSSGCA